MTKHSGELYLEICNEVERMPLAELIDKARLYAPHELKQALWLLTGAVADGIYLNIVDHRKDEDK